MSRRRISSCWRTWIISNQKEKSCCSKIIYKKTRNKVYLPHESVRQVSCGILIEAIFTLSTYAGGPNMRLISWGLIIVGIIFIGYHSIQYFQSTQSVSEYEATEENNNEKEENEEEKTQEEKEKIMSDELKRHNIGEDVATLKIPKLDKQFTTYW